MRIKVVYQPKDLEEEVNNFCDYLEYKGFNIVDIEVIIDVNNRTKALIKYVRA